MSFPYKDYVTSVSALTVTGVTTATLAYPTQINTVMLPLSYTRIPVVENSIATLTNVRDLKKCVVELVVIIEPIGQSTSLLNYTAALDLIDALEDAFVATARTTGIDSWLIALDIEDYGGKNFWVLVCRVQGSGV